MDGWIKKGGATPDRSRNPARGPLCGPNVLPFTEKTKRTLIEESKIKKLTYIFKRVVSEVCL
jgi:hypothetical protein